VVHYKDKKIQSNVKTHTIFHKYQINQRFGIDERKIDVLKNVGKYADEGRQCFQKRKS
jgi:hypothetical protein